MRILAIVQARMGSARLPGKALLDIAGKPMIAHVIERVRAIRQVDEVVLAMPGGDEDAPLWRWAVHGGLEGVRIRRVVNLPPEDVLGRFVAVCEGDAPDAIVRLTGDCPLLDPAIADLVIARYRNPPHVDYLSNVAPWYLDGTDVEIFSRDVLQRAHLEATDPIDREHVTPWMRRHARCALIGSRDDYSALKWSVDTEADLQRVRAIADRLPPGDFSLQSALAAVDHCAEPF